MADYGNATIADAPSDTVAASNYSLGTVTLAYGNATIASVGGTPEPPPRAYVRGTDHQWRPVT